MDSLLNCGDHRTVDARARAVQYAQGDDTGFRGDAAIHVRIVLEAGGIVGVSSDDTGHVSSVTVRIRRGGIARYKALVINDTRRAGISIRIQVRHIADATVDDGDANAGAIPAFGVGDVRVDGRDDGVHRAADLAVRRDVRHVRMGSEAVQIRTLNSYQLSMDEGEIRFYSCAVSGEVRKAC